MVATLSIGMSMETVSEVRWSCAVKTVVGQNTQLELDLLQDSQTAELCDPTSLPKKSVEWWRSGPLRRLLDRPRPSSSSRSCWSPAHGSDLLTPLCCYFVIFKAVYGSVPGFRKTQLFIKIIPSDFWGFIGFLGYIRFSVGLFGWALVDAIW